MKIYRTGQEESDNSVIGTVFFLPKTKDKIMIGNYWHTGIIYNGNVYETFNHGHNAITSSAKRLPELKKENAVFLDTKIYPEKLEREIKSGTSCEQFVLRVIGMSVLKGDDKGHLQPGEVYTMIKNRKH